MIASRELLRVISAAQTRFIAGSDTAKLFDELLADLVQLTGSEYGFVSEVLFEVDGAAYLDTRAVTEASWNEERRERFRSLYRFFNRVMASRQPLISNDPVSDLRSSRSFNRRRGVSAFLGLPILQGATLVGVAGIVNRVGGYDEALVTSLEPLLATCANLIEAHRADHRRRESERALLDSEARVRAVVDSALDAILTFDEFGHIDQVNPAAERMFGHSRSDMVQTPLAALISLANTQTPAAESDPGLLPVDLSRVGSRCDIVGHRQDGTTLPLEAVFSDMQIAGRRMFTGILRDISERRKIERLESEFVASVSHELRTPLTSIRGSIGLLVGGVAGPIPSQALEMMEIALRNSERLGRLIDDILDIEKIESSRLEMRPRLVDLAEQVRRSIEANQGFAYAHRVQLALVGEVPRVTVFADEDRLAQVLTNLISNAAKFSPPGEAVDVSIARRAEWVRVSIRDRGPGIDEDFKTRIFQRFAQAENSDLRQKTGTGLGLSIAKAIIERMRGRIGFEATEPRGTRFFFDLPIAGVPEVDDTEVNGDSSSRRLKSCSTSERPEEERTRSRSPVAATRS